MGKLVKYCSACEEGFAEKFSFCPNCASQLEAFEMKPVHEPASVGATKPEDSFITKEYSTQPAVEQGNAEVFTAPATAAFNENDIMEIDVEGEEKAAPEPEVEEVAEPTVAAVPPSANGNSSEKRYQTFTASGTDDYQAIEDDGGFHVTVIQEKNVKQRNLLLLASTFLILFLGFAGVVYSIFAKSLDLAAIDEDNLGVLVPEIEEAPMETEEIQKPKDDSAGGGGGGGGRNELVETSKGRLANQMPDPPLITPTKTIEQKNFDLKYQATTQGTRQFQQTEEKYGDPNSKNTAFLSDGTGSGGGQGSGIGTGQGSGRGTGQGSGIGSGSGSGIGDGDGDGRGSGQNNNNGSRPTAPPPPPRPVGVTQSVKIISKPRADYTDAARQQNIQGTVTLRVTFLASGAIGSISPVNGLGYGLTEKAIAAARAIRFEPAKKDGVPQTVTKSVQYNFTIY